MAQIVDLVRGYVGGCARNILGEPGTIPGKLVARIPNRVGQPLSTGRKDNAENAIKLLERVSKCDFDIEDPGMQKLNIILDPTKPAEEQPTVLGWALHFTAHIAVTPRSTT